MAVKKLATTKLVSKIKTCQDGLGGDTYSGKNGLTGNPLRGGEGLL